MKKEKIRIKIKGYDHAVVDGAVKAIVDLIIRTGSVVVGPIPLPTKRKVTTILRSVHKHKDSQEQFEMRIHSRLIEILEANNKTIEALQALNVSAGVEIEVRLWFKLNLKEGFWKWKKEF